MPTCTSTRCGIAGLGVIAGVLVFLVIEGAALPLKRDARPARPQREREPAKRRSSPRSAYASRSAARWPCFCQTNPSPRCAALVGLSAGTVHSAQTPCLFKLRK